MLALATKITQSDYDATKLSAYSSLVATVVQHCLIVEPAKRPDVVGVAGLVAEKILTYTDSVRYKCNSLEKKLEKEKNRSQRMLAGQQEMRVDSYESQVSKASNETEQGDAGGFLLLPATSAFEPRSVSDGGCGCEARTNRHGRSASSVNAERAGEARKSCESDVAVCGQKGKSSQPVNIHAQVGVQLPEKIVRKYYLLK